MHKCLGKTNCQSESVRLQLFPADILQRNPNPETALSQTQSTHLESFLPLFYVGHLPGSAQNSDSCGELKSAFYKRVVQDAFLPTPRFPLSVILAA